jgi:winged helix-turn helix protein
MAKRYRVTLTAEEREHLERLTRKGTASVRMVRRAQTLLLAAAEERDEDIAKALRIGVATVERTRRRCVAEGVEASLRERPRPGAPGRSWGRRSRPSWSRWPVPSHPRAANAGRCNSWRSASWSCRSSRTSPTRPSGGC